MKKSILILTIFAGASLAACAQSGAPKEVSDAFSAKFPTAKSVKWDKENDQEWEAEFKMDGKEYSANFLNNGEWLETEQELKKSDLPAAIVETIKIHFSDRKIEEIEKAETKDGVVYEVIFEKGEKEIEVVFDLSGKVVSQKEVLKTGND